MEISGNVGTGVGGVGVVDGSRRAREEIVALSNLKRCGKERSLEARDRPVGGRSTAALRRPLVWRKQQPTRLEAVEKKRHGLGGKQVKNRMGASRVLRTPARAKELPKGMQLVGLYSNELLP